METEPNILNHADNEDDDLEFAENHTPRRHEHAWVAVHDEQGNRLPFSTCSESDERDESTGEERTRIEEEEKRAYEEVWRQFELALAAVPTERQHRWLDSLRRFNQGLAECAKCGRCWDIRDPDCSNVECQVSDETYLPWLTLQADKYAQRERSVSPDRKHRFMTSQECPWERECEKCQLEQQLDWKEEYWKPECSMTDGEWFMREVLE
jgi:hypothetical protein